MRKISIISGLLVAALAVSVNLAFINAKPAEAVSWCGSACNGKPPSYRSCNASGAVQEVARGNPSATYHGVDQNGNEKLVTEKDPNMLVKVMYSRTCETLWGVVTNIKSMNRTACGAYVTRFIFPNEWSTSFLDCPVAGHSYTTPMADDHSPTYDVAARVGLMETLTRTRKVCKAYDYPSAPCKNIVTEHARFKYEKSY